MISSAQVNDMAETLRKQLETADIHDLMSVATHLNDVIAQRAFEVQNTPDLDEKVFGFAVQITKDADRFASSMNRLAEWAAEELS